MTPSIAPPPPIAALNADVAPDSAAVRRVPAPRTTSRQPRPFAPLAFRPILKRLRWGGRRLGDVLGKPIGSEADYAESWEVADHAAGQSVVSAGEYAGWTLRRLVEERNGGLFGRHAGRRQFPLLVKFLDADDRLSVQVHPDDRQARAYDPKENGKTEAWIVLDARPDSLLYAGLRMGVTAEDLRRAATEGGIESLLHAVPACAGDCLLIPAGTVHAITEGILLAEVQQASDLTFRLHDWDRVGADGLPRRLHPEQSLACIDFGRGPVRPVSPQRHRHGGGTTDDLVRSEHFVIRRHTVFGELWLPTEDRFHVLTCVRGAAEVLCGKASRPLPLGGTLLIPAAAADVTLRPLGAGEATVLESFLP